MHQKRRDFKDFQGAFPKFKKKQRLELFRIVKTKEAEDTIRDKIKKGRCRNLQQSCLPPFERIMP